MERRNIQGERIGQAAAAIGLIEVGLGSILHAFRVPLAGQFLSLNQAFFLTRFTREIRHERSARTFPARVSAIAALLKSFSPAGKRLTPMLAISAQGFLFSFGLILLGVNIAGFVLGGMLLAVWAFVQPIALYWLLFGQTAIDFVGQVAAEIHKFASIRPEHLLVVVGAFVGLKVFLGVFAVLAGCYVSDARVAKYQARLARAGLQREKQHQAVASSGDDPVSPESHTWWDAAIQALRDLAQPTYVFSVLALALFLYFVESEYVQIIWLVCRFVGVGFMLFFLLRALPVDRWLERHAKARGSAGGRPSVMMEALWIALRHIRGRAVSDTVHKT